MQNIRAGIVLPYIEIMRDKCFSFKKIISNINIKNLKVGRGRQNKFAAILV
jgi:hypothetical protein